LHCKQCCWQRVLLHCKQCCWQCVLLHCLAEKLNNPSRNRYRPSKNVVRTRVTYRSEFVVSGIKKEAQ
jgi:hypothetical protein